MEDPDDRRKVLAEYEAMKDCYKDLVNQKLCGGMNPYSFMAARILDKQLVAKISDTEYLERQEIKSSTRERAIEACRYLHLLERCRLNTAKKAEFPMWNTEEFWNYLIAHVKSNPVLREKNGVNLPHVKPRLNHLAKLYIQHGPGIVLNRRLGNKNSSKLGKCIADEGSKKQHTDFSQETYRTQLAVLMELRAHPNNLDFVQIADHYNLIAGESNWPSLTNMQVMNILKEGTIDLVTTPGRKGVNNFLNEKALQVKRRDPSDPLRFVTVDGWDVELAYQEMITGKKGKRITRYDNRLVVVIILDPFCKYPVGYAIDNTESAVLIKRAMKEAIDHVYEMTGQYIAPYQVQSDNYALKELGAFYSNIARMHTPARVGNAKSKVIEPYFKYLNKKYCQLLYNWTGFGITSRRENQPNLELKNVIKRQFPDRDGVIKQIEEIIFNERQAKGAEYFGALEQAPKRLMDRKDYLRALGIPRERTIKANGKGLLMEVNRAEYTFDSLDIEFRKHLNRHWNVTYDPDDMSSILVEDQDGKISFILEEKYVQPMAIADQTPEDRIELKKIRDKNQDLKTHVIETNKENRQLIEEHLSGNERLQSFRQKLMFTYNGQQKDPLQESKGKILPEEKEKKAIAANVKAHKETAKLQEQINQEQAEREFWERQEKIWDSKVDWSKF
jgi:hypothetical protein